MENGDKIRFFSAILNSIFDQRSRNWCKSILHFLSNQNVYFW